MEPNNQNGGAKPGNVIKPDNSDDTESKSTDNPSTDKNSAPQEADPAPQAAKAQNATNDAPQAAKVSEGADEAPQADSAQPQDSQPQTDAGTSQGSASVASFAGAGGPAKKGGSKKLIFGIVAAVVVAGLLGAGTYAYMEHNKPENRIKRAMGGLMEMEQGRVGLTAGAVQESSSTDMQFVGEFNSDDEKFHGSFGLEKIESGAIALSSSFKPSIEVLYEHSDEEQLPEDLYVKVSGVDKSVVDQMLGAGSGFESIEQEVQEFYDTYHDAWILVEDLQQYVDDEDEDTPDLELTDEDRDKLKDIIADAKLFAVEEELGSRDIEGVDADGFKVVPDSEGIVEVVTEIRDADLAIIEELNKNPDTELDFDEIIGNIEDGFDEFDDVDVEATLELWLDGSDLREVVFNAQDEDMDMDIAMTLYGIEPIEVEIPSDAVSSEQLVEDAQQVYTQYLFGSFETQTQPGQFESSEFNSTFESQPTTPDSVLGAFDIR